MVCKVNPAAGQLLAHIGVEVKDVPRIRDVWTNLDMTEVTVFTRTGGGNRDEYSAENRALTLRANYLRDADWPRDPTYAEFVFSMPAEAAAAMRADIESVLGDDAENKTRVMKVITTTAEQKFALAMEKLERLR